ncbi:MAG: ABC transporter substrate-binding protein [Actinomycetota bacterium]
MKRHVTAVAMALCVVSSACSDLRPVDSESRRSVITVDEPSVPGQPAPKKVAGQAPAPAVSPIQNPSNAEGGVLRIGKSGSWDSLDPANTSEPYARNLLRNYGRTLVVVRPGPGSVQLEPDLATDLGKASDDRKTWTYTLREGVTFEDGSPITSKDVKYAVERSLDKTRFPDGPGYFNELLDLQGYTSPYQDADPAKLGLKAIETPDDRTIVFKLVRSFAAFDYVAQLPATMPVPRVKDTGASYADHVVSSGPYKLEGKPTQAGFSLIRNSAYAGKTDPQSGRKPLPDRIEVAVNLAGDIIDQRLLSGQLDVEATGSGLLPTAASRVLKDPVLVREVRTAVQSRILLAFINPEIAPLDNLDCRKAILYAADRGAYQQAYGGSVEADIATSLLPPGYTGSAPPDPYKVADHPTGDVDRGRQSLAACGQPTGFVTGVGFRVDRATDRAAAESLRTSLARVGISVSLRPLPASGLFPGPTTGREYLKAHGIGLVVTERSADWPESTGFVARLFDNNAIRPVGSVANLAVMMPAVQAQIEAAEATRDATGRTKTWAKVASDVMDNALILPGAWAKAQFFPPGNLTNVYACPAFDMYDFAALGTTRR